MIPLTAQEIAEIVAGEYIGPSDLVISGEFRFDSRAIKKGEVFLALPGAKFDGHQFAQSAFEAGAALALTTKEVVGPHIQVEDVIEAISELAKEIRSRLKNLSVVAITGSQGKTTTKDILGTVLTRVGNTVIPENSYNNDLGVPLTLLRCDETTRFCIVEMGARHGGDISRLTAIAAPQVGAVLRVGTAHLGEFGSREVIAKTKGELIRGLGEGATAVLGTYDEFTPLMAEGLKVRRLTFGEVSGCDVRAADIEIKGGFAAFELVTPEGREPVDLQILGEHQISNALAAAAVAFALGIPTSQIAASLSEHKGGSKWRMELHDLGEVLLVNDSYNANPESMSAALKTLALLSQERGGNSWAFLGKMHELGADSPSFHIEIGKLAGELGIDHLVSIGVPEYLTGLAGTNTAGHLFPDIAGAESILNRLAGADVVLVKASRAEGLEKIAERIISNWSAAGEGGTER
jgi:UDP-N-acetylmuramoyl-tripeptide--D-alanyl-D-alanine ligase